MPYIAGAAVRASVRRLRSSVAGSSLADFLIFKRAQVHSGGAAAEVTTGLASHAFLAAHLEFAGLGPHYFRGAAELSGLQDPGIEYFVPFGENDSAGGYRTTKFPSNGPSDSVSRWANRENPPYVWVAGSSRPKRYRYVPRSVDGFQQFFFNRSGEDLLRYSHERPLLADLAVWWLRSRDIAGLVGEEGLQIEDAVDQCCQDLGLSVTERTALFNQQVPVGWPGIIDESASTEVHTFDSTEGEQ